MADVDQSLQITLTARDEASKNIAAVQQALEKLGATQLGGLEQALRSIGPALDAQAASVRALGTSVDDAGRHVTAFTAHVQEQTRAALGAASALHTLSAAFDRTATAARATDAQMQALGHTIAGALDEVGQSAASIGDRAAQATTAVGQAQAQQTALVEDNLRAQEQAIADHYQLEETTLQQSLLRQNALVAGAAAQRTALIGAGMGTAVAAGIAPVPVSYQTGAAGEHAVAGAAVAPEITPPRLDLAPLAESVQQMQRLTQQYTEALGRLEGAPTAPALPAGGGTGFGEQLAAKMQALDAFEEKLRRAGYAEGEFDRRLREGGMGALWEANIRMQPGFQPPTPGTSRFGGAGAGGGAGGIGGGGAGEAGAGGAEGFGGGGPFDLMVELVRNAMGSMATDTRAAMDQIAAAARTGFSQVEQSARSVLPGLSVRRGGGEAEGGFMGGLMSDRGLLGEKGLLGGGFEMPGLDMAKQFLVWGGIFTAVMQATQAVHNFAAGLVTTNVSYEDLKATLTTLYGSGGAAQRALDWLDQFAEKTPATREEVRQSGVAFAAVGDNIGLMVPAAERLSTAMRNTGGLGSATQAIVDAQFGRTEMLRQNLHLTIPELEKYGLVVEHNGHMAQDTFIPAIERMTGVLDDQYMKLHHLSADPRFINSIDLAMKTLSGTVSNLGDITEDVQRRMGAGLFRSLEGWLAPIVAGMGDQKGAGGAITSIADQLGRTLGDALTSGLHALTAWWDKLGGLPGVIRLVEQAWVQFTRALQTAWSIALGVGDAIKNVWNAATAIIAPLAEFFGGAGKGADGLRTLAATIGTAIIGLKLMATVLAPLKEMWEGLTGAIGLNTAAERENAVAAAQDAGAQETAAAAGAAQAATTLPAVLPMGAREGGAWSKGVPGESPALGRMGYEFGTMGEGMAAVGEDIVGLGAGMMGLAGAAASALWPLAALAAAIGVLDLAARSKAEGALEAQSGVLLGRSTTPLPLPPSTATAFGVGASGPLGGTTVGAPPTVATPGGALVTMPSPAEQFAASLPPDQKAAYLNMLHHRHDAAAIQGWIDVVSTSPTTRGRWLAGMSPQDQATGLQRIYGTPPGSPAQQYGQVQYQAQVAAAMPERRGELYGDLYQLQQIRMQQDAARGIIDPNAVARDIQRNVTAPFISQYGKYIPKSEGGTAPASAGQTPSDVLAQAAQTAAQQVQWDEALKVPYAQFKKDMDAAAKAMTAAGDPADAVKVFYKQHMDAWAKAAAGLAEQKLATDEALHKPYAQISADLDDLAGKLRAEGDSNDQIALKLGQAVEQYFDGLIQATDAQRSALQTIGGSTGAQLGLVAQHQQQMQAENAGLLAVGKPAKYTPEEIQAAGISGEKEVWSQALQTDQQTLTYHEAIGASWQTMMGDITGMASDGARAHETAAQLFAQTTQSIQQAATSALSMAETLGRSPAQIGRMIEGAVASYAATPGVTPAMARVFRIGLERQYMQPFYQADYASVQTAFGAAQQAGTIRTPADVTRWADRETAAERRLGPQAGETPQEFNQRLHADHMAVLRTGFGTLASIADKHYQYDSQVAIPNMRQLQQDTNDRIRVLGLERKAGVITPEDYRLGVQAATRDFQNLYGNATPGQVPAPRFGRESAFGEATAYGGATAFYGPIGVTSDPNAALVRHLQDVIRTLQKQLANAEKQVAQEEKQVAQLEGIHHDTQQMAYHAQGHTMGHEPVYASPGGRMRASGGGPLHHRS